MIPWLPCITNESPPVSYSNNAALRFDYIPVAYRKTKLPMKCIWYFFTILVCVLSTSPVFGQSTLKLTLDQSIEIAQSSSPAAEIARLQFEQSQWDHRAFRSSYLPTIALSGDAPGLERSIDGIVQDDGSMRYVPQSRTFSTMRMLVNQNIPLTGGSVYMSSGLSRIDLFGNRSSFAWQSTPMVVGLRQPLFQFNEMKWERRLEPMRFQYARRTFAESLENAAVEITNLFFNVVIARMNVENATFNVAVNDTIYALSQGRFELGKIAENDLLQSELALLNAQTDLSDARIALDRALQDLKTALGVAYDTEIEVIPPFNIMMLDIDPVEAVAYARQHRAAFVNMELQRLQAEQEVSRARHNSGFSANLTASYGLNQSAETIGDVYTNPLNQQRLTVGFQIPIYQWGRGKAELEAALADQERTERELRLQREELEQEVYFEALQLIQLQQQVSLAAKADTIASRRFEVARNRYTIGTIDITDLFDAQVAKDGASQAFIRTLHQYWASYFRLRRMTLYDFENDRPLTAIVR